jgi:hypothetical protein
VKLDESFYIDSQNLVEALDHVQGSWTKNKTRGYGLCLININNLNFAIPLRSYIKYKASFVTKKSSSQACLGKGQFILTGSTTQKVFFIQEQVELQH